MKSRVMQLSIPLSRLVLSPRNPRKVKPGREAHQRLVALIRTQGLIHPLLVRPMEGKSKRFEVIAGKRRYEALQEIHRGKRDPQIDCMVRDIDAESAYRLSVGENVGREPMHPLDEAEAFANMANSDGKDAKAIAAEFGVKEHYVRQRMKLAALAGVVKEAYRKSEIDTGTAEAFAAVPEERQIEVWKEINGHPRHADHVRNVIANGWIDSSCALFDIATLPDGAVSKDLFGERILIERQAFMEAQARALEGERHKLVDEGWKEVVSGRREDMQDRLLSMNGPKREFDADTARKLDMIVKRREKVEAKAAEVEDGDDRRMNRLQAMVEALDDEERELIQAAPIHFSEETKSIATVFLMLGPDGTVHREYRLPHRRRHSSNGEGHKGGSESADAVRPPTSDDLSDKQLSATFTHQAMMVREALLANPKARKRILVLILHDKVHSEGLAIRHEANGTTLHATRGEEFKSVAWNRLKEKRSKIDPFAEQDHIEDLKAYERLIKLSDAAVDSLIDILIVDLITAHMQRRTDLVYHLSGELEVNLRNEWRPDAAWLGGFQKIQLAHLLTELQGAAHAPSPECKKTELVQVLAKLFIDSAEGKIEDKRLADRVNGWLPSNIREMKKRRHTSKHD